MSYSLQNIKLRMLFLAALILAVFGNTLNHGFVWDDFPVIVNNPMLQDLGNIPRFFLMEDIAEGSTGYYRPMTYLSFALDRALWGTNPVGFNITNLALHILVALAFYRVVAALFKREDLAFAAALIFALHPITCETVSFHAGGRNTLLCALFALLSLLFYLRRKWLPALLFFVAAIFSKEFALLLPAVFLLYDWTVDQEKKPRWLGYLPYLAAIACYLALRSYSVASHANLLQAVNLSDNFWIVPQTIVGYLKLMLWPFALKTMYDVNTQITWSSFIGNALVIVALAALALVFRKRREVLFSVCLFLLFLLPVTNLIPLGTAMMADRYAYFSLFGFSLGLAYLVCLLPQKAMLGALTALGLLFVTVDLRRNSFWKDEVSLFSQMIQDAPQMCVGYQNLGYAYYAREDLPGALRNLAAAQDKKDQSVRTLTSSALTLLELERPDLAVAALNKAIELEPQNPEPYVLASRIHEDLGDQSLAKWHHDRAWALVPGIFEQAEQRAASATGKGQELLAQGNLLKAERHLYAAVGFNPLYLPALINLGTLAEQRKQSHKALHYFSKAARLDPANPALRYQLSLALDRLGKRAEAQQEMTRFRELDALARQKGATR